MRNFEDFHGAFLEEMHALENFRMTYAGMHPSVPIEREDPEVRRLLEAMALFTARTRASALKNLLGTGRRLFQQFFSFLLTPVPAACMLEARTGGQFVDRVDLPRGTEFMVTPPGGETSLFWTLDELKILPFRIDRVETLLLPGGGFRVLVHFRTAFARNDEIGTVSLHVNHLNDYQASLRVLDGIKKHLVATSVWFDETPTEQSAGAPCPVSFGAPTSDSPPAPPHPLEEARSFFHFPERELYVNFDVPAPPRNWRKFTIGLDLDEDWPKGLRLHREVLRLFVVPAVSLRRAMAQPFLCDGTIERYLVRHPQPGARFALHSIIGVYEIEKKGLTPLRPGTIGGGSGSFEIERASAGEVAGAAWVRLNVPDALKSPKKIAVEANWYHRWATDQAATGRPAVALHDRHVAGALFDIVGEVRPDLENPLKDDSDALLTILALKHKTVLDMADLLVLLDALGTVRQGHSKRVQELFTSLDVSAVPDAREQGNGLRYIYKIGLQEFDETFRPVVAGALERLARVLNSWVSGAAVTVEAAIPGTAERFTFE